jgi:hypothetical protein
VDTEHWQTLAEQHLTDLLQLPWTIGDWAAAAVDHPTLHDRLTEILRSRPDIDGAQLAHYTYVAQRIPPERRHHLPWTYHDAVASLPPDDADRLLYLATLEGWTLTELRRIARTVKAETT